ncbi:hypothetical protein RN001_000447 [Aquatica leii]|uniref:Guanine nucleotide-binding protein G(s) subunit alpha n=1 Tax=Aquatica leii TaxID=1421715 RepID=A0AAN7SC83_9COLE|nr:hypothetical protein RN001_000447 [Aquatica leii]
MLCINKPPSEEKKVSQIIDNGLKSEKKRLERIQQILLLGTGESGKTTIIKQMKILHINGFSEQEKMEKVPNIKQNIHESIFTLIDNMDKISPPVDLEVEDNKKLAQYIRNIGPNPPTEYTNEYYDSIQSLWADPGVRKTYMRANEFQLIDSAAHFLDRINDIRDADYIPTVQDMLFCRVMTVSISKIEFKIPYKGQKVEFWMYDVGGQRGERKKWISVFEGIGAILFLIAASDFDQTLREDGKTNRLREGFQVFADIFWSRFVRKAGKIVFLNKQDILKKKIENGKKIEKHFPEFANFEKTKNDYDRAKLFMKNKILEIATTQPGTETVEFIPGVDIKQEIKSELLYIHFTIATDTNNVKLVFNDVKDIIIAINLETSGLV